MTLAELIKQKKLPATVIIPDLQLKSLYDNSYGNYTTSYNFKSNQIVIVKADNYFGQLKTYQARMFLPGEQDKIVTLQLSENFSFELESNDTHKMFMDSFNAARIKNLRTELALAMQIGADPEIFAELNGEVLPAFEFLPDKKNKLVAKEPWCNYNNNFYWDGYQAEFDTSPFSCLAFFTDNMRSALHSLRSVVTKHNKAAKLSTQTTMLIPQERLAKDKPEHVEFGCMPSYNAYGMEGIKDDGRNVGFRSAGGHLHLGITPWFKGNTPTHEEVAPIVKAMDAIVGVAAVAMMGKYDNPMRRTMYGLAGEYRIPEHGLEYRVLSNSWLFHPLAMNLIWELARKAAIFGHVGLMNHWKCSEEETIRIINTCDVEAARKVMMDNREIVQGLYDARFCSPVIAEFCFGAIIDGIDSVVEDFTNLDLNWNLNGSWCTHNGLKGRTIASACNMIKVDKKVNKIGAA